MPVKFRMSSGAVLVNVSMGTLLNGTVIMNVDFIAQAVLGAGKKKKH